MPKPNTRDAMKRFRAGKAGFTDKAHLKAKGLIPRADGTKKKSPQYEAKSNQEKIAIDTVKNPNKSLLGGPTASEAEKMLRTKFGYTDKQIAKLKEDAPANATGTAVAGTGDDSSTVVVRRKKDKEKMKDRLLRRFKIRETIDRLVPAIEPPTDEVRERVDQLKTLALGEAFTSQQIRQAYGILNDPKYKQGNYSGAVSAIEKLAKGLSKHPDVANALRRANEGFASDAQRRAAFASGYKAKGKKKKKEETELEEDMDRQPQDKDVKKVKGTQPKKYYKTLPKDMKKKRAAFFRKQKYKKSDDDDDYKPAPGDKGAKTKPSIHTKKFKKMYGEDAPANATGVAVAGTGDDSSTVIVRKRKEMRDRLLKRFKIKESIDRAIPDIVEEPDEIRTRTDQLKELAKLDETIVAVKNKAKKTGMPYSILKKVYDRGMAAWKGGHRPGATQQQWALARVNSFVTKSSGTWGGADKDLAKQVRARG